ARAAQISRADHARPEKGRAGQERPRSQGRLSPRPRRGPDFVRRGRADDGGADRARVVRERQLLRAVRRLPRRSDVRDPPRLRHPARPEHGGARFDLAGRRRRLGAATRQRLAGRAADGGGIRAWRGFPFLSRSSVLPLVSFERRASPRLRPLPPAKPEPAWPSWPSLWALPLLTRHRMSWPKGWPELPGLPASRRCRWMDRPAWREWRGSPESPVAGPRSRGRRSPALRRQASGARFSWSFLSTDLGKQWKRPN